MASDREPDPGCRRGCRKDDCYCNKPTRAEINHECAGCGGQFGECYCGEGY